MLVLCTLLLLLSARQHSCEDGNTEKTEYGIPSEDSGIQASTEAGSPNLPEVTVAATVTNAINPEDPPPPKVTSRGARRRGQRFRGYYNSDRFRNNAYNPYNPDSPYSYRGRPPQPPYVQGGYYRTGYENSYYDPYKQGYYNYPGYPQAGYYGYPYQPQPPAPQPGPVPYPQVPTPPPTEAIPDLYYVRDSPAGYQYQKISIAPDVGSPRQQPVYGQAPQGYYGYQYDPYRRPPLPAHQPQSYYQPSQYGYSQDQQSTAYQQQLQWAQRYNYPRGRRPRFVRTGRPTLRLPGTGHSWKLTIAPESQFDLPSQKPSSVPSEQETEANVD